ncbi:aminotransferase class III-fold pyridoxal phosphate-dependent enzyme [Paracoccus sp. S-4012]|uniref:aminotransferase class III-fold pyridoxal phosphate-dependent enzyme n=1 Tax=Paracoccus sp. S-4012 TaxID=2665648 RepID=UPI0012AF508D|nr:aspartate aminotransferase family protein [Paracoccus sp. S-4012]MRX51793.1 aminotransferase class III-fold pyridoxal phosphate-dependent enzyme [Paracoccus sp. S-4012]
MPGMIVNDVDADLRERASAVIPGGMWGHQRAAVLPAGYPQYFAGGEGARVTDVNGNSYIDFMCAWGPIVLGHRYRAVEEAGVAQVLAGDCLDGPTRHTVELAELLVQTVAHADWAMLQKNGTDATTACVTIARAATGRRKVLVARGAYHGAVPWCTPSLAGVTAEDRAHLLHFDYNDPESLRAAAREAGGDLAAVLVSAFRHDLAIPQEAPDPEFARAAREICDEAGAVLILDDVRAGFRLHMGGSWEGTGVRPDLTAFSKAIANGWPLAAVTGSEWLREAAGKVFVTGSFWYTGAAMAAAVVTIRELARIDGPALMRRAGERFRAGLAEQAARHGFELRQTGPASMPLVQFADDPEAKLGERFCQEALRRGVYLHHKHNMFICCAHTDAVIDDALAATDDAMKALAQGR